MNWNHKKPDKHIHELPPVPTQEYWEAEFKGAYSGGAWDGEAYVSWNNLLNQLAQEGEQYCQDLGN